MSLGRDDLSFNGLKYIDRPVNNKLYPFYVITFITSEDRTRFIYLLKQCKRISDQFQKRDYNDALMKSHLKPSQRACHIEMEIKDLRSVLSEFLNDSKTIIIISVLVKYNLI